MPSRKSKTIYNWKKSGLIYDDYDELYETYIKTMQCGHCQTEFTKKNCRCLDHDHTTGLFRKIICNRCNVCDSYIKYPFGYSKQDRKEYKQEYWQKNKDKLTEQGKEYQRANKEKLKEYNQAYRRANKEQIKEQRKEYLRANKAEISANRKEKIECECGSIVRRGDISTHRRTKKHSNYKLNNLV